MGRYLLKRISFLIPTLIVVSFITFLLMNFSNVDPAAASLQAQGIPMVTEEMIEEEREALGLNEPFLQRYVKWVGNCVQLEFGTSYARKVPVLQLILPAFLNTVRLTFFSALALVLAAFFLGILCAVTQGSFIDKGIRTMVVGIGSMPNYWIGMILLVYIGVKADLLPISGTGGWQHYVLPIICMTIPNIRFQFRLIRNSMIRNKNEGYVLYGRASGLPEKVILKHIFRNSLSTAISSICLAIPRMLGGAVVVENLFVWPGAGKLCVEAIGSRDIPVIQAYIVVIATAFILFNIFGDLVNALLNPRMRGENG